MYKYKKKNILYLIYRLLFGLLHIFERLMSRDGLDICSLSLGYL